LKGSEKVEAKGAILMDEVEYKGIVQNIKQGDVDWLIEWIDDKKSKLYKMAWAYLRNHADVEDVFHNTIIKVLENIDKLKSEEAFESWFISILLNECRKILRDKKRILPYEEIEVTNNNINSGTYDTKVDLINGLGDIDEGCKELIILKYYSGYSQKEIAEILDMPLGTVKQKFLEALRLFVIY
jgi:RNA polymerase sigma-70 factor (ECF subfamily)